MFRLITGAYCFGCGGTRAAILLLSGQVAASFCYNPIVPYLAVSVPGLLLYYVCCLRKKSVFSQRVWKSVLFFGIFLMAANFLIKNYMLFFRQVDLLKLLDGGLR